jgi:recombination protein RecT
MTTEQLRAVATRQAAPKTTNFPALLEQYKGEIARALPKHLNADTMTRIALTCFRMNPKLSECTPPSVFACVVQASQLGLRPGLLGECYLIPYKRKFKEGNQWREQMECQLQVGYQGLLELVRRSGLVESIAAYVVHERDTWSVHYGTNPGIEHVPNFDGDPGAVKLLYAVAKIKGGGTHVEVMTVRQIEAIRDRSQNVRSAKQFGKETPWDTDFEEMARKTVIRRICKYLPKSPDLALAMAVDDAAHRGVQALSVDEAIAGTFVPPPLELEATETAQDGAQSDAASGVNGDSAAPESAQPATDAAAPISDPNRVPTDAELAAEAARHGRK